MGWIRRRNNFRAAKGGWKYEFYPENLKDDDLAEMKYQMQEGVENPDYRGCDIERVHPKDIPLAQWNIEIKYIDQKLNRLNRIRSALLEQLLQHQINLIDLIH